MKSATTILVGLCALALLLPAAAKAQCPFDPATLPVINCAESSTGDNTGGANNYDDYTGCNYSAYGPEEYWHLVVSEQSDVTVTLTPDDADLVVAIIPYDCDLDGCYDTGDGFSIDVASATLPAGDYIVVADGYSVSSESSYAIDVACVANPCVDADGDGYDGYDAVDCPNGSDCCDTGDEGGLGCDAAHAAGINPDSLEICEDGIDQNCDGSDDTCVQQCTNSIAISCNTTVAGDSSGGANNISDYSCLGFTETGLEAYYLLDLQADMTVTAAVTPNPSFDAAIAILPEMNSVCTPGACIAGQDNGNPESASADLTAGTYYIVVDAYGGASGTFDLEVQCGNCTDSDNDGYNAVDPANCPAGDDCDDSDPNIHPGANETCGDATDSNCDGFECDELCVPGADIACGDVGVAGNNSAAGSTPNFFDSYPDCPSGAYASGPEYAYTFTPAEDSPLTITVTAGAGFDPVLVLLADAGNGCEPTGCLALSDNTASAGTEVIQTNVTAGTTYYIVVDGYTGANNTGDYTISVVCGEICEDLDGDGYNAFDAANCPSGTDCCDSGDEGGPGCDANNAPDINPGVWEICEDNIDQDCDGSDATCPTCASSATIDCDTTNSGSVDLAASGSADIDDYCGGLGAYYGIDWSGPEYIFDFTPDVDTGVEFATTAQDIIVLQAFNQDTCNPGRCETYGGESYQGQPPADFLALAGVTYWISVDHPSTAASNTFDWTLSCLPEQACVLDAGALECDSTASGNNTGADDNVDIYGIGWPMPAGEVVYSLSVPYDSAITVTMTMPGGADLALLVLEDDGSGDCLPRNAIGFSDEYQTVGDEPEVVTFQAAAGANYFVVVDAWDVAEHGAFNLTIESVLDCGSATQCDCQCFDTQTDVAHCGDCDTVCSFANATPLCNAGACAMGACDANFGDCNTDPADGCEVDHLNDPNHCGDCATACSGATPFCVDGACTDQCPGNLVDCGGTCVDTQTDLNHCGGCDQACALANTETQACVAGNCEIVACTTGYDDCDTDDATGCEVQLGTDDNCSACGDACSADNGTAACTDGACELTACDDGYADCDDDLATGCETALGTVDHCSGCDDACSYDNATAACTDGACELEACDTNYGDCDQDADTNGCETMLNTGSNCGECGHACGALEGCTGDDVNGYACTAACTDGDGDGFADHTCGGPDCNDADAAIHPGAAEACNDVDDDCDGATDEGFDLDGDGYKSCGDEADCDDTDPDVHPGATEICQDGLDNDCVGGDAECSCADADKDGYQDEACGGTDCDDADATVNPDAAELCDQADNNCNGEIDEGGVCENGTSGGCGCASANSSPAAGGLLLLALVLGLALPRRRNS